MHLPEPVFPPLLTGRPVEAPRKPFEEACGRADRGELGAGDLLWSRSTARAECALILEPEIPLRRAVQMGPLMQVALADCLGALLPPRVGVQFRWPATLLLNGAKAGETRICSAPARREDVPEWLVVGFSLWLTHDFGGREPGEALGETSFAEEGAGELTRTAILQSFAAHFLAWLNLWQDDGFRPVHDAWIGRVEGREAPAEIVYGTERIRARALGLDEEAGLIVQPEAGRTRVLPLLDELETWAREQAAP
jgi:BirA family transcriptional regulator, biotin operon repressor / biotin---[acetyl-CoA-carboxylase] ligase